MRRKKNDGKAVAEETKEVQPKLFGFRAVYVFDRF
jgi:hypothetical protein